MRCVRVTSLIIVGVPPTGYLRHFSHVISTSSRTSVVPDTPTTMVPNWLFFLWWNQACRRAGMFVFINRVLWRTMRCEVTEVNHEILWDSPNAGSYSSGAPRKYEWEAWPFQPNCFVTCRLFRVSHEKRAPPPKDFVVVNVRPFVSVRLSAFVGAAFTGRIFVKYYIGDLKNAKIRRETADLVKIVQKYRALFVRTQVLLHR